MVFPMVLSSHPVLQRLGGLDASATDFHHQLDNILYGEEYARCVENLQGDDLIWLVDFLDNVLDGPAFASATFPRCLQELRNLCETRMILPTSYAHSSRLIINPESFASGGSGDVYQGSLDGSKVCIKRVRVYAGEGQSEATRTFCREVVLWKHLRHPNIVSVLGATITPSQLISDWVSGGDLPENVKNPNVDRLGLLSDVAQGLCYLHSYNIIHGDLKGCNILVDNSNHARIADFGLVMVTQDLNFMQSASSPTSRWTAPEVLEDGPYSKEADVFSFAMVMIEAFTGAVPFSEKQSTAAIYDIMNGSRPQRPTHPTFTTELWALMQSCWNQDPRSRPTVSEVLNVLRGSNYPAWKLLISATLPTHELISLITVVFSNSDQIKAIKNLPGNDAQAFVDKIDGVLDGLTLQTHRKCLRYLFEICGSHALLPRSLEIPLRYDPAEDPISRSGLADVRKGRYRGREVAAQVFRIWPGDDAGKIRRRFCREVVTWRGLRHPNVLPLLGVTMSESQLVMVSEWMANGNIMQFTKADADADRLGLLRGVARGLTYMHDQKIVHGNLRGANILIDDDGHARLAGFALVTIASDRTSVTSTQGAGGAVAWMSPELLYPQKFGLEKRRPTTGSDCYALGMVIYEVLCGRAPFSNRKDPEVVLLVLQGERPERPRREEGKMFTDEMWEIVEDCWRQGPNDRISARNVLISLGGNLSSMRPPSDTIEDPEIDDDDRSEDGETRFEGPPIVPSVEGTRDRLPKGGFRCRVVRVVHGAKRLFKPKYLPHRANRPTR